jgi:hypothetical protein
VRAEHDKLAVRATRTHMLQCLSKARTRPRSLWLLRKLISTCVLFFTLRMRMEKGPLASCSCSFSSLSSGAAFFASRLRE